MLSTNVVNYDKMQYTSDGLYVDERDGFISWLRGEFAAANAIIDSMCHHLKSLGEGREYDEVIGCIQQRRCNWSPVLHMQQYFSVAEVLHALQRVMWRRQKPDRGGYYDQVKVCKRSGGVGLRQGCNSTGANESSNLVLVSDEKDVKLAKYNNGLCTKPQLDSNQKVQDSKSTLTGNSEYEVKELDHKCNPNLKVCSDVHLKSDLSSTHIAHLKPNVSAVAKTFDVSNMQDGKLINAVEGMRMYEDLFDDSEVGKMVSLVNDLRIAGRQQKFQEWDQMASF
ncbi:hypothetical protein QVD17_18937 [Tagetes erecta]|uniref:Uncharacterized protein n=1 Tax=Tagetes erecta TaxID=13708 RepID=A0AAD8NWS8_TARER|nr:hypothetical protein QVD17_18937 [Tagetes erecta]